MGTGRRRGETPGANVVPRQNRGPRPILRSSLLRRSRRENPVIGSTPNAASGINNKNKTIIIVFYGIYLLLNLKAICHFQMAICFRISALKMASGLTNQEPRKCVCRAMSRAGRWANRSISYGIANCRGSAFVSRRPHRVYGRGVRQDRKCETVWRHLTPNDFER